MPTTGVNGRSVAVGVGSGVVVGLGVGVSGGVGDDVGAEVYVLVRMGLGVIGAPPFGLPQADKRTNISRPSREILFISPP